MGGVIRHVRTQWALPICLFQTQLESKEVRRAGIVDGDPEGGIPVR
jgi:hypothetical protein